MAVPVVLFATGFVAVAALRLRLADVKVPDPIGSGATRVRAGGTDPRIGSAANRDGVLTYRSYTRPS